MIRALLFDVDGTLAETEELHRRAFNATFAAAGLPWHWSPTRYAELLTVAGGRERLTIDYTLTVGIGKCATPKSSPPSAPQAATPRSSSE